MNEFVSPALKLLEDERDGFTQGYFIDKVPHCCHCAWRRFGVTLSDLVEVNRAWASDAPVNCRYCPVTKSLEEPHEHR